MDLWLSKPPPVHIEPEMFWAQELAANAQVARRDREQEQESNLSKSEEIGLYS